MKKSILLSLLTVLFVLFSCKKKDSPQVAEPDPTEDKENVTQQVEEIERSNKAQVQAFVNYVAPIFGKVAPETVKNAELPQILKWLENSNYKKIFEIYSSLGNERVRAFIAEDINGNSLVFAEVPEKIRIEDFKEDYIILQNKKGGEGGGEGDDTEKDIEFCLYQHCSVVNKNNYRCVQAQKVCPKLIQCQSSADCKPADGGDDGTEGGGTDTDLVVRDLFGF